MSKNLTNISTLIFLGAIFAIFITLIINLGQDVLLNDNSNLDDESILYIAEINGADTSKFDIEAKNESDLSLNPSGGTNKDFAIEFFDSQDKYNTIKSYSYAIFYAPSFLIEKVFRIDVGQYTWILNIIAAVIWVMIFLAGYYLIRRVVT
jgi:hypothetical protein